MNVISEKISAVALLGLSLFVLTGKPLLAQIDSESPPVSIEAPSESVLPPGQIRQQQQQMMGQMQMKIGQMQQMMGQMTPEQMNEHHQWMLDQMEQISAHMDGMMSQAGERMMDTPGRQDVPMMMNDSSQGMGRGMMLGPSQGIAPEAGEAFEEE